MGDGEGTGDGCCGCSGMLRGMLARMGDRLGAFFRATAPDPFVIAILLTLVTMILGVALTDESPTDMVEHWQGGFWNLLAFGMQMCLILVTGHALASSAPVARAIRGVAGLARGPRHAVALTSVVAMMCALVNWGFGLIVGAILARDVGRTLEARGVRVPRGLLAAAGYTGLLVWHGGLSGSAPLKVTTDKDQVEVLGEALAAQVGAIPVTQTLFTWMNLGVTGGLLVLVPLLLVMMCPRGEGITGSGDQGIKGGEDSATTVGVDAPVEANDGVGSVPAALERSPWVVWIIALPALAWIAWRFASDGLDALDLNMAILLFLSLGLVTHGSATSYAHAVEDGARGCAGIIIQFPIYAGIMGMIVGSGLAVMTSSWFVGMAHGSAGGLSVMMFLSAGLVNLFVPSGGGQWAIQGPIGMQAAMDAGIDPARIVMAVSYGDELTNMLQPFWALPLLAITGAKAQEVVGYTAVVMVAAAAWMGAWLFLF